MKSKLKKWVALIGLMAAFLLIIGGTVGVAARDVRPDTSPGTTLQSQKENSTLKPNDPGNSAVMDGGFRSRAKDWAKDHGLGGLYGVGVGLGVGLAVAGIAVLAVAGAPVLAIIGAGALVGGLYGLITGAIKFDIWDCVLFSAIGAASAGVGSFLPGAGLMGWIGRGAVEGVAGGLMSLGSYLLHDPHPTWGGAGQAFSLGAVTAIAFMGLGAGVNKLLGGRLAALGGKLRKLLPWGRGAGTAVEAAEAGAGAGARTTAVGGAAGRGGSSAVAEGLGSGSGSALEAEAAVTADGALMERVDSSVLEMEAPTTPVDTANGLREFGSFTRTETPTGRMTYMRGDIDWALARPVKINGRVQMMTNAEAAAKGFAPMRLSSSGKFEGVQLHHMNQDSEGAFAELWSSTHSKVPHKMVGSGQSWRNVPGREAAYNAERAMYWKWRIWDGVKGD